MLRSDIQSSQDNGGTIYDKLQTALLSVTGSDKFVVLGDFNARVGSHAMCDDELGHVRGPHGCGNVTALASTCCLFSVTTMLLSVTPGFCKKSIMQAVMATLSNKTVACHCFCYCSSA